MASVRWPMWSGSPIVFGKFRIKLILMNEYLSSLMRFRPPVGWWDLLDIAIVSILIYEFLKLIRGTRAVQMAVGSLLIVALFYVSRLAPLQTLNWMIRNVLVY